MSYRVRCSHDGQFAWPLRPSPGRVRPAPTHRYYRMVTDSCHSVLEYRTTASRVQVPPSSLTDFGDRFGTGKCSEVRSISMTVIAPARTYRQPRAADAFRRAALEPWGRIAAPHSQVKPREPPPNSRQTPAG